MARIRTRPALGFTLVLPLVLVVATAWGQTAFPLLPFATIAAGKTSGVRQPARVVIREAASWQRLWRRHAGPTAEPPSVDFGREMVIALFAGETRRPVALAIARITREAGTLVVWYTQVDTRPLPQPEDVRVTPFHIVRLARSRLPVKFVRIKTPPVGRSFP